MFLRVLEYYTGQARQMAGNGKGRAKYKLNASSSLQRLTLTAQGSENPLGFTPLSALSWKVVSFLSSFMASL